MGFIHKTRTKLEAVKSGIKQFETNEHAEYGKLMTGGIVAIVSLVVIALLGSALLPQAVTAINDTDTTGWQSGAASMWTSTTIFVVLAFLLIILGVALYVVKQFE